MRKIIYIIVSIFTLVTFAACDVTTSDNGDLDGFWQLRTVNYKHGGVCDSLVDVKANQVYWSVQYSLLSIRYLGAYQVDAQSIEFVSHFAHSGDSLAINSLYKHFVAADSLLPANTKLFETIGIKGNSARFAVKQLNDKAMTLESDYAQLNFRKY